MANRLLFVLSEDPADPTLVDAYVEWNAEHLRVMASLPGIVSAQGYRIDPAFETLIGERAETPRYRHLNVFEVEDGFARQVDGVAVHGRRLTAGA